MRKDWVAWENAMRISCLARANYFIYLAGLASVVGSVLGGAELM